LKIRVLLGFVYGAKTLPLTQTIEIIGKLWWQNVSTFCVFVCIRILYIKIISPMIGLILISYQILWSCRGVPTWELLGDDLYYIWFLVAIVWIRLSIALEDKWLPLSLWLFKTLVLMYIKLLCLLWSIAWFLLYFCFVRLLQRKEIYEMMEYRSYWCYWCILINMFCCMKFIMRINIKWSSPLSLCILLFLL